MENSIYLENQNLRINELRLKRRIEELEAKVKEQELAINYSQCCKNDSEQLPKRLSNEAYTMARGTDHKTFTKWWDMQKV